uniref:Uncharacterized protein n=1 Tax=Fagus sylvatica TaxID=28930 RepID=A0A2N9HH04_FAGSY
MRHTMIPARAMQLPRGSLILHASPPPNPPRFSCAYPFLTRFFRAVLEVLWYSKWVMQHIVGKLSTSSFQRYKVCTNRSSDEESYGSRKSGCRSCFCVHFSGEDSGQTGDAIGEPRVPRRSRSRHLSNAPGLADQLVATCAAYFCKVPGFAGNPSLDLSRDMVPRTEATGSVFGPFEGSFPIRIPARPGKILAIREFHVVHACVFFPNVPRARGSTCCESGRLCAQAWQRRWENSGNFQQQPYFVGLFSRAWYRPCTEASLGSQDMILRTEAVGMFLMPRGGGQFDPAFGLVNGPSNLGQTWSNFEKCIPDQVLRVFWHSGPQSGQKQLGQTSVNLGQTWSKLSGLWEMYPGSRFEGSRYIGPLSGSKRLGQTSVKLVNLGKTWSDFGKCVPDLRFEVI